MRIAYLYVLTRENQLGVERKAVQQARALEALGFEDFDIVILNPTRTVRADGIDYVRFPSRPFPLNYFDFVFRKYQLIERSIDLSDYDYLILRYPLADRTAMAFARSHRVITEHHTNEAEELRSRIKFATSPLDWFSHRVLLALEERYAGDMLRLCRGVIGTSEEIRQVELERSDNTLAAITVANGIDVASVPFTRFAKFNGDNLELLFISSSLRPWHGLDRVIESFNSYRGDVVWNIHIVGNIEPHESGTVASDNGSLLFHGPLHGVALDQLMKQMHVAISSMAEYRINVQEIGPLKTREYTARGLPFVLAYHDPDLAFVDEKSRFFLSFANDSTLLDVGLIIDFVAKASSQREVISQYMRRYALAHMDWQVKLRSYKEFVELVDRRA